MPAAATSGVYSLTLLNELHAESHSNVQFYTCMVFCTPKEMLIKSDLKVLLQQIHEGGGAIPIPPSIPALFPVLGCRALISIPTVRGHLVVERIHQNKIEQDNESLIDGTHFPNQGLSKFTTNLLWL